MKLVLILCVLVITACGQTYPTTKKISGIGVTVYIPTEVQANVTKVGDMLMGRVHGLEVRRSSNGGHTFRVRGPRTLRGSEEPLLVLDGTPLPIGVLNTLSPHDIDRVHVLRNAGIYGSRGYYGVVVVETKHGKR